MSRVVNAVVVALAAIVLVAGVVWYVAVVGQEEKVSADVKWRVESTDEQRTVVVADVLFQNRLEADLELVGVEVAYEVAGVAVASNHSEDPGTLAARGSLSVPMRLLVPPDVAIDVVRQHVISDETSAAVLEGRGVFHVG
ncbi:MAG: hypothetical protein HYT80_03115, partial [Euryarchaeota archaeon]|nr:hypothetical protein [Euryarchaeota archaeon]